MLTGNREQDRAEYLRLAAHEKAVLLRPANTPAQTAIARKCLIRYEALAESLK